MMQLFDDQPTERRCAIPLLVELCAGTAALSLRLERAGARPPVSRMGAKTGYADCILALAGLEPGAKAEHYVFCEPDEGVRLLLHAYRDADLAREAAAIIRSWADEEPRALWERLRAEGPARCPPVDAREVGRVVTVGQWAYRRMEPDSGWCAVGVARGDGKIHEGDRKPARNIAGDVGNCGGLPATIHDDATTLDPREVARAAFLWRGSFSQKGPAAGIGSPEGKAPSRTFGGFRPALDELQALPPFNGRPAGFPATINDDATTTPIPDALPDGSLVFIDPPYVDTTGYAHDLDRPAVVRLAQQWAAAGARVMISEAVPIEALVACGWHAVEVSAMRVGQRRTFSKQQREWVTMSFAPDRRALRACELAAERAERAATAMAGGEQRSLFGVP